MADKVAMKALDTLHMSNVHAENIMAGDIILVSEADAKHLEDRGLAERGGSASKAINAPRDEAPAVRANTREELDAERGETKALIGAPANKGDAPTIKRAPARKGK